MITIRKFVFFEMPGNLIGFWLKLAIVGDTVHLLLAGRAYDRLK